MFTSNLQQYFYPLKKRKEKYHMHVISSQSINFTFYKFNVFFNKHLLLDENISFKDKGNTIYGYMYLLDLNIKIYRKQ